ncbi:uncharacterized protein BJ171DRAFT_493826 [Polychytrium aggregatum]|uniref:uncharacterized protein n=1 Tax=Polychytrium aggregatum TaxID=110093 RepID=UPI0022FEC8D0|nr:uncharacterized protein BJ171DRAFT_493826 [Polychytrium aggregatum]KAI9207182.1 hypothetical protein BJ171DRAFT_493826 [Polychytrium aggregatum]
MKPKQMTPLKLRVGQFNLCNLNKAHTPFYNFAHGYTDEQVHAKVEWTANQLRRMNASIVGFEEVFHEEPLHQAAELAGYDMAKTTLLCPGTDGTQPCVGLLSVYPIVEWCSITDFPSECIFDLSAEQDDDQLELPMKTFQKPVLRAVIQLPVDRTITVFVAHMKSKRPLVRWRDRFDLKQTAIGGALSLIIRAAEAAALRCLLIDETRGRPSPCVRGGNPQSRSKHRQTLEVKTAAPARRSRSRSASSARSDISGVDADEAIRTTILIGDLNDTAHSVSTEIMSGTHPWKKKSYDERKMTYHSLLSSTNDVQIRASDKDVTYTHIHNGRYDVLDHILVSNDLVRANPNHIGYVQYLQHFNDHLIDATLMEDDDNDDLPLKLAPADSYAPDIALHALHALDLHDPAASSSPPSSGPTTPSSSSRKAGHKPSPLPVPRESDHGQVMAILKIYPPGWNSEAERQKMIQMGYQSPTEIEVPNIM